MTRFGGPVDPRRYRQRPETRRERDPLHWEPIFPEPDAYHDSGPHVQPGSWLSRHLAGLVVFVLLAGGLLGGWLYLPEIRLFLASMGHIGPGNSPEEQVKGLIAVGLLGATIVSVVRILTHERDRRR